MAHNCLGYYNPSTGRVVDWHLRKGTVKIRHKPSGRMQFNSTQALIETATDGAGIICMPDILVQEAVAKRQLVPLLTDWETQKRPLFLLYPPHEYLPHKVKAFSKFVLGLWAKKAG